MKYSTIKNAVFLKRPNRFIAHVLLDNKEETVHVKNTGRCREILNTGTPVILEESTNPNRKTKYSLIAGFKDRTLINIDSQAPNQVVYEALKQDKIQEISRIHTLKREVNYKSSRFDLYFENNFGRGFIEVKGVTLEEDGIAMFPDAPTERGTRHVLEMINAVENGYCGYIFFLIQLKGVICFTPHRLMDPDFAKALKYAKEKGVIILAYDSIVTANEITIGSQLEVRL
ncbi:MAG: DNA/RNA nuclease SfsA [Bacillota bacterium]